MYILCICIFYKTLKNKVSDADRYLKYLSNPKICKDCGKPIEFERRRHNVCKQCYIQPYSRKQDLYDRAGY